MFDQPPWLRPAREQRLRQAAHHTKWRKARAVRAQWSKSQLQDEEALLQAEILAILAARQSSSDSSPDTQPAT